MTTAELHPDMTMGALLEAFPGARRVLFREYHIGGCSSCGFGMEETLRQVCKRNEGAAVEEVLDRLRQGAEEDERYLMEPRDLKDALSAAGAILLDIRTREEFDAVHIEGAERFTQEVLQEAVSSWRRDRPVIIVDHTGNHSLDAAAYFTGHGFTNVRAVRGGIDAYSEQVDPSLPRYTLELEES
jgi:rhodanese-related sulfurtransferase